jgi:two-component system OmpR family response regulator
MRLLLIEDDAEAANYLARALGEIGHDVEVAADGRAGRERALAAGHDLIIADRNLPYVDGLSIVQALRAAGHSVPVLILSALGSVDDRIEGLRAGGDDYLIKPFSFDELQARIEALLRRGQGATVLTRLKVADLELDLLSRTVTRAGKRIDLTVKEFQLLEYLMRRQGQVVTRSMLLEGVWDLHFDPQTNIIDVHMSRLRAAVDRDFPRPLIHTVRGAGYVLRDGG